MTTLASVAPTTSAAPVAEPPARFRDLLASEWIKVRSLRSTPWTIALTTLFVIGSSAVAALADYKHIAKAGTATRQPHDFLPFDAYPPAGYMTLMLVACSIGAITVVSEYSSGLIRTTMVAVPARGAVVLAKAVVTAALWTAVGTAISTGSFLVSQAILNGQHAGVPFTHPGVLRALVASALLAPVCALVGLGLGVWIRHSAATMVTSVFTLLMLPTLFSQSERWSADINHTMVVAAWKRLVQNWGPSPEAHMFTATVPGSWIVYALWPLIAVTLAVVAVRHRDV
ncbi:ABC transporter permease [Streptomyces inhibens]|uniref:ABC transporter permease n=1 Tax=Streptomyces inhibens TaxID=2293571 RepID=UPI001EE70665|nr:ABC transporter permease [Streptomyces inhibens]UKY54705.1 ABC transporter permease [Streptomyces inhibens]